MLIAVGITTVAIPPISVLAGAGATAALSAIPLAIMSAPGAYDVKFKQGTFKLPLMYYDRRLKRSIPQLEKIKTA